MDRHTAKGSQLSRRDSVISHVSQAGAAHGSTSPEVNRAGPSLPKQRPASAHYQSPLEAPAGVYNVGHAGPPRPFVNGTHSPRDSMQHHGVNGFHHDQGYQQDIHQSHISSPISVSHAPVANRVAAYSGGSPAQTQPRYGTANTTTPHQTPFVPQQNVMPFNLPPSQYSGGQGVSQPDGGNSYEMTGHTDYPDASQHSSEMLMLGNMAMQATVPMFGTDGVLNKSPYVGMPEDFLTYLFNTASPGERSPMSKDMLQGAYSK